MFLILLTYKFNTLGVEMFYEFIKILYCILYGLRSYLEMNSIISIFLISIKWFYLISVHEPMRQSFLSIQCHF